MRVRDAIRAVEAISAAGGNAVVMSYWNPVLHYGVDAFARDLAAAGGLGMITPDLIPDEAEAWLAAADAYDLDRIFLVAPSSTPERLARTVDASRGFVYAASTMGVTGARDVVSQAAPELVRRVKEISDIPVGVGLGVRSREQAARDRALMPTVSSSVQPWCPRLPTTGLPRSAHWPTNLPSGFERRCPLRDHNRACLFPQPGAGRLVPGPVPDPGLRAVHHRRHHRRPGDRRSSLGSPRRRARRRSTTSRCGRCRSASSVAGSTT